MLLRLTVVMFKVQTKSGWWLVCWWACLAFLLAGFYDGLGRIVVDKSVRRCIDDV